MGVLRFREVKDLFRVIQLESGKDGILNKVFFAIKFLFLGIFFLFSDLFFVGIKDQVEMSYISGKKSLCFLSFLILYQVGCFSFFGYEWRMVGIFFYSVVLRSDKIMNENVLYSFWFVVRIQLMWVFLLFFYFIIIIRRGYTVVFRFVFLRLFQCMDYVCFWKKNFWGNFVLFWF